MPAQLPANFGFPSKMSYSLWIRNTDLVKVEGQGHITNGSRVATTKKFQAIPSGTEGTVVTTGTASSYAAREATGTTKAKKVMFYLPLSAWADGVYQITVIQPGDQPALIGWGGLLAGAWIYDDGDQPEKPGLFQDKETTTAALNYFKSIR